MQPFNQIEALARELAEVKRRLAALEARVDSQLAAPHEPQEDMALPALRGLDAARTIAPVEGSMALFGRALLGLGGAYLLRAVTENQVLPAQAGVLAAVAYAAWWLYCAVRTPAGNRLAVTLHGLTAVLVLYPMLWETTVRFHVLPHAATAAVLSAFAALGMAIAWKHEKSPVVWITTMAGLATTVALIIATHDLVPFVSALLFIAASIEFSACRDHWLGLRWAAALITNLSVLLMMFLVTREGGLPEGYAPISPLVTLAFQGALLAVYLSSTVIRTLVRGLHISFFETGQTAAALVILITGALRVTQGAGAAGLAVAVFLLGGGLACYLAAFAWLDRRTGHDRNFYTYSTFGVLLVSAGLRVLLPGLWRSPVWCALAVTGAAMATHHGRGTLLVHSIAYLAFAAVSSGLPAFAALQLFGGAQQAAAGLPLLLATTLAAALCYGIVVRKGGDFDEDSFARAAGVVLIATFLWGAGGLIHWSALWAASAAGLAASHSFSAVAGTCFFTASACLLAWAGSRWARQEFRWLVYPIMILGGYKLIAYDFPQARTHAVAVSLLLFGGAMILLPRLLRRESR
ncbi:MAG: hypothetical protein HY858_05905 [Candidatus Solibacter usitatus]|nr:hypothetical protein [Candidatus Solibacter usitatus]